MISIENFYWILFDNLLKPVDLDCWYYYPFGSTANLSRENEFKSVSNPRQYNHALFHFDQEPIWIKDLGLLYDSYPMSWSSKTVKILANSEKSQIKKDICRDRNMLDWYFFYHGFAALDWFRDSQFIDDQQNISNIFLSFNHLVKKHRSYRISLLCRLIDRNIMARGSVSFHASKEHCLQEIEDGNTQLSDQSKRLIEKHITEFNALPMFIDGPTINSNASAQFGHQEYKIWQRSFVHLVNETVFYDQKLHLTEKVFKPIVSLRPFVLVSAPGNLGYLRSYGFATFGDWWDESYDDLVDPDERLDAITKIITDLCSKPFDEIKKMLADMKPVLDYNKRHFFSGFRKRIVDELVDNFDACIRIWNNGRIDGRNIPSHPDTESVKRILLR